MTLPSLVFFLFYSKKIFFLFFACELVMADYFDDILGESVWDTYWPIPASSHAPLLISVFRFFIFGSPPRIIHSESNRWSSRKHRKRRLISEKSRRSILTTVTIKMFPFFFFNFSFINSLFTTSEEIANIGSKSRTQERTATQNLFHFLISFMILFHKYLSSLSLFLFLLLSLF